MEEQVSKFLQSIYKPFAGYKDWDECESENNKRLCGWLQARSEGHKKKSEVDKSLASDLAKVIAGIVVGYGGVVAISKVKEELLRRGIKPEAVDAGIASAIGTIVAGIALKQKGDSIIYHEQEPESVIVNKSQMSFTTIPESNIHAGDYVKYGEQVGQVVSIFRNYLTVLKDDHTHEQVHIKGAIKISKAPFEMQDVQKLRFDHMLSWDYMTKPVRREVMRDAGVYDILLDADNTVSDANWEGLPNKIKDLLRKWGIHGKDTGSGVANTSHAWDKNKAIVSESVASHEDEKKEPCKACGGVGRILRGATEENCPHCFGSGNEPETKKKSCPVCKEDFDSVKTRSKHMYDKHFGHNITVSDKVEQIDLSNGVEKATDTNKGDYGNYDSCPKCRSERLDVQTRGNKVRTSCADCGWSSGYEVEKSIDKKKADGKHRGQHYCPECIFWFDTAKELKDHLETVHGFVNAMKEQSTEKDTTTKERLISDLKARYQQIIAFGVADMDDFNHGRISEHEYNDFKEEHTRMKERIKRQIDELLSRNKSVDIMKAMEDIVVLTRKQFPPIHAKLEQVPQYDNRTIGQQYKDYLRNKDKPKKPKEPLSTDQVAGEYRRDMLPEETKL